MNECLKDETILPTINRELSWLLFNDRVLDEAIKGSNPLFERCRFLSISASNLDEFFMIRVGSLFDLKIIKPDAFDEKTKMSVDDQLKAVFKATQSHLNRREVTYNKLLDDLSLSKIKTINVDKWTHVETEHFQSVFDQEFRPLLNLQVIDPKHPFPHLNNQQLYIAIRFRHKEKIKEAILSYPAQLFMPTVALPLLHQYKFAFTEDVIWAFADQLVPGIVLEKVIVRVTRNADLNPENSDEDDTIDFKTVMKQLLKKRNRLQPVRLEIRFPISDDFKVAVAKRFDLHSRQVYLLKSPMTYRFIDDLERFLINQHSNSFYPKHIPAWPASLVRNEAIIPQIISKDIFISTPFHTMEPIVLLLREAAWDPKVSAIKITLYRVASDSRILYELIQAAENGKDVVVVLELKARFDEANNIDWSTKLESAGCHVIYGMEQYKVHSKVMVILRTDKGKLQTITHIGSGNYNENTAKIYTDGHLLSANPKLGKETLNFFNTLQTGILSDHWSDSFELLAVSPNGIKDRLIAMIEREINNLHLYGNGKLVFKMNSLTDLDIIFSLIKASCEGVDIDLIVRGICCLVPNVEDSTSNIRVTSIVGRFLEHSRYYYADNNGKPEVYLSSADLMTRNMSKRIELAVKLVDPDIIKEIQDQIDILLLDVDNARTMKNDFTYEQKKGESFNSHAILIEKCKSDRSISKIPMNRFKLSYWISLINR